MDGNFALQGGGSSKRPQFRKEEELRQQLAEQQQMREKWLSKIESTSVRRVGSDDHDVDEFSEDLFLSFKVLCSNLSKGSLIMRLQLTSETAFVT